MPHPPSHSGPVLGRHRRRLRRPVRSRGTPRLAAALVPAALVAPVVAGLLVSAASATPGTAPAPPTYQLEVTAAEDQLSCEDGSVSVTVAYRQGPGPVEVALTRRGSVDFADSGPLGPGESLELTDPRTVPRGETVHYLVARTAPDEAEVLDELTVTRPQDCGGTPAPLDLSVTTDGGELSCDAGPVTAAVVYRQGPGPVEIGLVRESSVEQTGHAASVRAEPADLADVGTVTPGGTLALHDGVPLVAGESVRYLVVLTAPDTDTVVDAFQVSRPADCEHTGIQHDSGPVALPDAGTAAPADDGAPGLLLVASASAGVLAVAWLTWGALRRYHGRGER